MKTINLIACIALACICNVNAQTTTPAPQTPQSQVQTQTLTPASGTQEQGAKPLGSQLHPSPGAAGVQPMTNMQPGQRMNRYMVLVPHTKEQCEAIKNQMKEKGNAMIMRFDWGCASGDHTGYAMLVGQNEDAVRKQLPEGVQKTAKINKVEKYNNAQQMEQMHQTK